MASLNAQYIKDHMANIHTNDSWARAIAERALAEAVTKIGTSSADAVTIDAKFHVTAIETKGCVSLCTEIGGVLICTHINL